MSTGVLHKMLWHAKRLFRTTSSSGSPTTYRERLTSGVEISLTYPHVRKRFDASSAKPSNPDVERLIRRAVILTGVSRERAEDFEFYFHAQKELGFLTHIQLRKFGPLLGRDAKHRLGIRTSGFVAAPFAETLNGRGLADPIEASWKLALTINQSLGARCMLLPGQSCRFLPSNMAAGPCHGAASMAGKIYTGGDVSDLPLPDCPHPDQCACRYLIEYSPFD